MKGLEMELKKEKYRDFTITFNVSEKGKFHCYSECVGSVYATRNGGGFDDLPSAENAIKHKIDEFYLLTPKNYGELADMVDKCLVWTGYEDCYCDSESLKVIVENFIKYKNL